MKDAKKRHVNSTKKKLRNFLRKRIQKNVRCRICHAIVLLSDLKSEGYTYQCLHCDEDLFTFEVYEGDDVTVDEMKEIKKLVIPLFRIVTHDNSQNILLKKGCS